MNAERAAGPARHNLKLKLKEDIDGLMLIVKKLRQLIDQKDEKIKEMEKQLLKYEEKERHNTKQGKANA